MSKNKILDTALSIIDDYILLDHKELIKKIYVETGYCDQDYNKFLSVITNGSLTLGDYIRKRKLYYAVLDLIDNPDKPLSIIAQDYGYSEQSAFTRAVKAEYGKTPAALRKNRQPIPDNRKLLESNLSNQSRLDTVMDMLDSDYQLSEANWHYFEDFIYATEKLGFDISTCCLISELSEKLSIPFSELIEQCFQMAIKYEENVEDHALEMIDFMMELEIESEDELKALCQHYQCKWYELTFVMVKMYQLGINTKEELHRIWKHYECRWELGDPYPVTRQMVEEYRQLHK